MFYFERNNEFAVPERLVRAVTHFRSEKREAIYLVWTAIFKKAFSKDKEEFVPVSQREFLKVVGRRGTIAAAIKFLKAKRFIETKPHRQHITSRRYRIRDFKTVAKVKTTHKTLDEFKSETADDPLSQFTREMMSLLIADDNKLNEIQQEIETRTTSKAPKQLIHFFYTTRDVKFNVGKIHRAKASKGRRLFSPFCQMSEDARYCFSFDGQPLVGCDLASSQWLLLGTLSKDEQLVNDCCQSIFYEEIISMLGASGTTVDRPTVKSKSLSYLYGGRSIAGLAAHLKKKYPRAMSLRRKSSVKSRLSIELQKLEARIFIDGVLQQCRKLEIPALSVHDNIYTNDTHAKTVRALTQAECEKHLEHKNFTLREERRENKKPTS